MGGGPERWITVESGVNNLDKTGPSLSLIYISHRSTNLLRVDALELGSHADGIVVSRITDLFRVSGSEEITERLGLIWKHSLHK